MNNPNRAILLAVSDLKKIAEALRTNKEYELAELVEDYINLADYLGLIDKKHMNTLNKFINFFCFCRQLIFPISFFASILYQTIVSYKVRINCETVVLMLTINLLKSLVKRD